ncbi:AfsR/SARP family transcriptional regulator [Streptomyces sp. NPDC001904]|uniref:AfsR/SARP family transcriptional regulator n=1 Tax=Streptomyces sp. NPDC001904 TaxID=3154531 RepID=UPI00332402D5
MQIRDADTGIVLGPAGARGRILLGALAARAGQAVPVRQLIEEVWAGAPPAGAPNALQAHVTRLRRLLTVRQDAAGPGRSTVVAGALGYALRPGAGRLDAERFGQLVAQGRARAAADPDGAGELLRAALSLWRGPALEGSRGGAVCDAAAARLEELRLVAAEALYDLCLHGGRHAQIVAELEELTAAHPLRERLNEQLMVALCRLGRPAEALGVYERTRRCWLRELGVEPGPALARRARAIAGHAVPDTAAHAAGLQGAAPDGGGPLSARGLRQEIARLERGIERLSARRGELVGRLEALGADGTVRA